MTIPGLPAPVTIQLNQWTGKRRLLVGETEIPMTRRGKFEFVTREGQRIPGQMGRAAFLQAYPEVEFGGVTYKTGVEAPIWLKAVTMLPMLLIAAGILDGVVAATLGAVIGVAAMMTNIAVIRSGAGKATVIATSIGTFIVAVLAYIIVAGVILLVLD